MILLPLKYTIGIRLSPEEELRGLDHIGKQLFSKDLSFVFNLAHGEMWELNDEPKKSQTSLTGSSSTRPPSYTASSGLAANFARSRSKSGGSRQVRLRSDISQTRPAYSRSQSQQENPSLKSKSDSPA